MCVELIDGFLVALLVGLSGGARAWSSSCDPMDYIYREFGILKLKEAYRQNLVTVLENLLKLTSEILGKIVISTDHGELLGENNLIGHPGGYNHPLLLEISWFEID